MADNIQTILGNLISSASSDYEVQKFLGSGAYGAVIQCRKVSTNETVALKILKKKGLEERAKEEMVILERMKALNSEKFNIIGLNDSFTFKDHFCLEFEKLDISLREFLRMNHHQLDLTEIRPVVQQLATALQFLKSAGIVHADLKPENIMMVDHVRQPLRVKVIDFGLAHDDPWAWTGATFQTLWYRSPEVLLGACYDEAIDTWSLGCIAAEMLLGNVLYPGYDESDMVKHIVSTVGLPSQHLLTQGLHTEQFFPVYQGLDRFLWSFMPSPEVKIPTLSHPCTITSLKDIVQPSIYFGADGRADECDRASFLDLLTKMLIVDPSHRITPSQILQHPFITMSHLVGNNSFHAKMCTELMSTCQDVSSGNKDDLAQEILKQSTSDSVHPAGLNGQEQPSLRSAMKSGKKRKGRELSPDTVPPKKRRMSNLDEDQVEAGGEKNRNPDPTPPKKRRTECMDAAQPVEASGGKKRKREDGPSEENSPSKQKRTVNRKEELLNGLRKLINTKRRQAQRD